MKIEKKTIEKMDYSALSDRDKVVVEEVSNFLKENDIINEETKEIILKTFEVKPIPIYDHSNNKILEHCKKLKIWVTTQGFIREGKYPNVTQYSIVSIQTEVRNLEKLYDSIINEINSIKNDIIKSNEKN